MASIIGIPDPSFGIADSHTMYASAQWNYGSGLETYRDAGNGPYTHYIDNTHPSATNTGNTYGSPSKPRTTIPSNLPAGSVVEIHGGPYTYTVGGVIPMGGTGTVSQPIFIRGYSSSSKSSFKKPVTVSGSYVIIENIDLNNWSTSNDSGFDINDLNHIAIRACDIRNGPNATTSAVAISGSVSNESTYIVIHNNTIHENGDYLATYDQDHHGVGIFQYCNHIWVINNTLYRNSGDGVQINGDRTTTHHIYLGNNTSYQNKQSGMWCKHASDVIFSQNTCYNHRPSDSSPGQGMGFQYGPERVWFLYNTIYDCEIGIYTGSDDPPGDGLDSYYIGNLIYNIHTTDPGWNPSTSFNSAAFMLAGGTNRYIINNTIYDVDAGINIPYGDPIYVVNNIISNQNEPLAHHIFVETSNASSVVDNDILDGTIRISWNGSNYSSIASFHTATGKGNNCLNSNPLFTNTSTNDFTLQSGSPAKDAGTTSTVYNTFLSLYGLSISVDHANNARPQNTLWDIGAFEFSSTSSLSIDVPSGAIIVSGQEADFVSGQQVESDLAAIAIYGLEPSYYNANQSCDVADLPLVEKSHLIYEAFAYSNRIPASVTLPDKWVAIPENSFTTSRGIQLDVLSEGELVYNGTSLSNIQVRNDSEHANYAINVRTIGTENMQFEIRGRRLDADNYVSLIVDAANNIVKLCETVDGVMMHLTSASHSFIFETIYEYNTQLWMYNDNIFGIINGAELCCATSSHFVNQHGFSLAVSALNIYDPIYFTLLSVSETMAQVEPQLSSSDLMVQFRLQIKEACENPITRDWESFRKARTLWEKGKDYGHDDDTWTRLGYAIKEPTPDAWFQ